MSWTPEKDLILCREIIFQNPYNEKKKSIQRSAIWDSIADKLNDIDTPRFNMDKRSVRDHIGILIKRQKRKLAAEEKASGINPEPTELDDALEEIITLDEASEMELLELNYEKKEKVEQDKLKATDIRQKAMEKLRETQLRQRDGGEKKKRKRRNGDDTLKFLKEKSDKDIELRKEEFKLKQSQQSMEEKRVDALLALQKQQQDNQMAQQEQQKQMMNMQMLMFNQQQEQTKALMSLMDKFVTSKQ